MSNRSYPICSQPLSSPLQTTTPRFIPLSQLAVKILTIPRPRPAVPRIPPEPELWTNGELLVRGPWEQPGNSSAQLLPRLCLLSSLTSVTEIFPKNRIFALLPSPQSLWLCQGWKWLCFDRICSSQICWLFFSPHRVLAVPNWRGFGFGSVEKFIIL